MENERAIIIGNVLRSIRRNANLTQKEFSEKFNIAPTTYSGYESGKHEPTIDFLIRVADEYKMPMDFMVGRKTTSDEASEVMAQMLSPFKDSTLPKEEQLNQVQNYIKNMMKEMQSALNQIEKMK